MGGPEKEKSIYCLEIRNGPLTYFEYGANGRDNDFSP